MNYPCDPNDMAFARPEASGIEAQSGLTKREYFAALAMQGFSANGNDDLAIKPAKLIASWAVEQADALIAELNK